MRIGNVYPGHTSGPVVAVYLRPERFSLGLCLTRFDTSCDYADTTAARTRFQESVYRPRDRRLTHGVRVTF